MPTEKSLIEIAIVAPCYNEAEVLPSSIPKLVGLIEELISKHNCSKNSYVVLVDDGSKDLTWNLIKEAAEKLPHVIRGVRLSRNAGHQNALMAGLNYVTGGCDAVISIDVDLQDDLEALPLMIAEYRAGAEIVLGVKKLRVADSLFKRISAKAFYSGMKWMGVDLVENHADCRLMSSKALKNLAKFPEHLLFLRGLQPLIHGKISTVTYDISPRLEGVSKYPLKKMLALAWNGVTSFSIMPLRLISWIGGIVFFISLIFAIMALFKAIDGDTLPGWASITIPLYLLGGLIVLSIGIVGEYVAKIFLEVKRRPRFLIDEIAHHDVLISNE
ncbi:glycosyltransferase family 2 protein [Rhodoferax sp.]|uniref:glycosyltransferase family 2 protein n=1 Tax=Rhodoferax sp. TaxID=50421 RepID=UPI00374D178A